MQVCELEREELIRAQLKLLARESLKRKNWRIPVPILINLQGAGRHQAAQVAAGRRTMSRNFQ